MNQSDDTRSQSPKRRWLVVIVLLTLFILVFAVVVSAHPVDRSLATIAWLDTPDLTPPTNTEFVVTIRISDVVGLYGGQFSLSFDPTKLQATDNQVTPLDCPKEGFVVQNTIDNGTGTIDYGITQLNPDPPINGSCAVAEFGLTSQQAAATTVALTTVLLSDVDGKPIAHTTQDLTLYLPEFSISKDYASSQIAGMPISYTLTVDNTGGLATDLLVTDVLTDTIEWVNGGNYDVGTRTISWTVPSLAGDTSTDVQFEGLLACSGEALNDDYRVASSGEGISSPAGPPVTFTIQAPTIVAGFTQSAQNVQPGSEVTFNSNSTTNGTGLTYEWDFDDGSTGAGAQVTHTFNGVKDDSFDVTLTATDECGYSDSVTVVGAVVLVTDYYIFLPISVK